MFDLTPVNMYCPNCGHKLSGFQAADGSLQITCKRCRTVVCSKVRNVRTRVLKIVVPN